MKLIPIIGALLISAAPVQAIEINQPQAFETKEEFDKACSASRENIKLCTGAIQYSSFVYITGILCRLEDDGLLAAEQLTEWWKQNGFNYPRLNDLFKEGIKAGLEPYPSCPIKFVP